MVRPLLTLSKRRVAEELERARQADEDERVWRRKLAGVGARCGGWYAAGVFATAYGIHTTNYELGVTLFYYGLFVAGVGPLATAFSFWRAHTS